MTVTANCLDGGGRLNTMKARKNAIGYWNIYFTFLLYTYANKDYRKVGTGRYFQWTSSKSMRLLDSLYDTYATLSERSERKVVVFGLLPK